MERSNFLRKHEAFFLKAQENKQLSIDEHYENTSAIKPKGEMLKELLQQQANAGQRAHEEQVAELEPDI